MNKIKEKQNIPKDWAYEFLGDLLLREKGKLPKKLVSEKNEFANTPYLTIKTIDGGLPYYTNSNDGVFATQNDILIVADGSGSGRIYRGYEGVVSSTFLKIISRNTKKVSNDYIEQLLTHINLMQPEFRKGGAIPHLDISQIQKIQFVLPPPFEQRRIVEILSAINSVIQKTENIISQTEKLKTGLMRNLFTKGIGHTKFKNTQVGRVPASWNVDLLDSVAKRGSGHTPNKQHVDYWNGDIKWVSLSDSKVLDNRYVYETDKEISLEGIKHSSAVLHRKDTVIVCRDAGIGRAGILGMDNMAVSQHFIAWRCGEKLNYVYLYYLLQSWRKIFERIATGTTIKTIGLRFFKELFIPLPDIMEQKKIGEILWSIDDKILVNKQLKEKLTALKKGVMSDLLGGKVQVNINQHGK
jgi:type I restriction enzyme S subunit